MCVVDVRNRRRVELLAVGRVRDISWLFKSCVVGLA